MTKKGYLIEKAVAVLISYASGPDADPAQFEEVLKSAYDAIKSLQAYSREG